MSEFNRTEFCERVDSIRQWQARDVESSLKVNIFLVVIIIATLVILKLTKAKTLWQGLMVLILVFWGAVMAMNMTQGAVFYLFGKCYAGG